MTDIQQSQSEFFQSELKGSISEEWETVGRFNVDSSKNNER